MNDQIEDIDDVEDDNEPELSDEERRIRYEEAKADVWREEAGLEDDATSPIPEDEFMNQMDNCDEDETDLQPDQMTNLNEVELNDYTVEGLIRILRKTCNPTDKLMFRFSPGKTECFLFDLESKNGTAVFDLVKGKVN